MKLKTMLTPFLWCISLILHAQEKNYSVASIPEELKQNANAVVRLSNYNVLVKNEKSMYINYTKVITVLNAEGDRFVRLYEFYDNDTKITKISAKEYNANGFEVREYKKKQFNDRSAVNGFYSDNRVKFLDYTPRTYPYTIEFQCNIKTKTTAFIPSWFPIPYYNVSVEKSEYIINNPKDILYFKNEQNFVGTTIQNLSKSNKIHYVLENNKAVKAEKYMPLSNSVLPRLKIGLSSFSLKGYTGTNIHNWKDFGKWIRENLYEDRVELDENTINKVKKLVANETDPLKKAKLIYEFMQSKTRYVLVGIGVGGWQPSLASDVDKLGYGDCKGLTNYTKALLDVAGIKSDWVIVYGDQYYNHNFDKEFTRIQGNHMILNIPEINNGKDVWLECTSQSIPFGFLGNYTDDRDVLVLTKEGGVIKHTPKYKEQNNLQTTHTNIVIDTLGNLQANLKRVSKGIQYDYVFRNEKKKERNLKEYYKSQWSYNNNVILKNIEFLNKKDSIEFTEQINIEIPKYATFLGNEIMLRPNTFNMSLWGLKKYKKRTHPFYVNGGFVDVDTTYIKIPKQYKVNGIPPAINIKNKFGSYKVDITKVDEQTLLYTRFYHLKEAQYANNDYEAYYKFRKKIAKKDNLKIVLIKKEKDEKEITINTHNL